MLVRFVGLTIELGKGVPLAKYLDYLTELNEGEFNFSERKRLFFCQESDDAKYLNGAFITIKDHKKYCELDHSQGNERIVVRTLDENRDLMDFNFFVVNKKTGSILYQYYHHSCSANQFGIFLRQKYAELRDTMIKETISALPIHQQNDVDHRNNVLQGFHGDLRWRVMVKPENLGEILTDLKRISSFEFPLVSFEPNEKAFSPLGQHASRVKEIITFKRGSTSEILIANLCAFVSQKGLPKGKVRGVDQNDIPRAIDILNMPDQFAEYDFDKLVSQIDNFSLEKLEDCWLTKELQRVISAQRHLFEVN